MPASSGADPPTPSRRHRVAAPTIAAFAVGALCALPFAYLVIQGAGRVGRLGEILAAEEIGALLARSVGLAATVALGAGLLGTTLAWLVGRTDLPGRAVWPTVLALPLVIPSFVGAFTLIAALAPGGLLDEYVLGPLGIERAPGRIEGFAPAATVLVILTYPLVFLPVLAALRGLPASVEECARSLGRRPSAVFRTVVLPQLRAPIAAGMLLVFLYSLSEFGAVQLLRYDTLTRAIYTTRLDQPVTTSLALVLALVALAAVAADRVIARRGHVPAAAGGRPPAPIALRRWRAPAVAAVFLVTLVGVVVPVAVLAQWALRGGPGTELHTDELPAIAGTTAALGIVGGLVTVTAVLPVAYATIRRRSRASEIAGALVTAGFALPGLVVALALAYFVLRAPLVDALYGTSTVLVIAYLVHFGAQGLRSAGVAVGSVPPRLLDAARSLGAGRVRRLLTVEWPLMRRGLAAAFGLVMLAVLKELPATLLLRPAGTETLATRIFETTESGFYAQAGVYSLALLAVSAVLTYALTIRAVRRGP